VVDGFLDGLRLTTRRKHETVDREHNESQHQRANDRAIHALAGLRRDRLVALDFSDSRFTPSGVISYTHANTGDGTKPIASSTTIERGSQSGAANIGSTVPETCTISQPATA
jgi:hypothetical protein